jgi:hypothetical protein
MKRLKDFLQKEGADRSPDEDNDGYLSPEELHKHLDIQNRGKVDIGDYAAHIMFHAHHPEYLAHAVENFNDVQRRHANGEMVNPDDSVFAKMKGAKTLVATSEPMVEGRTGQSQDKDPPAILIMRRKSVRQFPNGQRVALYYVDKINKYVTVPYEDMQWGASYTEETVIDQLSYSAQYKDKVVVEHFDGTTTEVTPEMAQNIISLYNKINEANKAKMLEMLEASSKHFQTIAKFSKE